MVFGLTDEQKEIRKLCRDFAKREITPFIEEREREGVFRRDIFEKMGKEGFFGCLFPPEYGGTGSGFMTLSIIMEEFSRASVETAICWNNQAVNVPMAIYLFGTEEQKKKYIPKLINAEMIGCFALTEPDAGSDNAGMQTRATRNKDGYVLNGSKMWATLGNVADLILVFAKTDPSAGAKGISAFLVETKNLKGFDGRKIPSSIGTNIIPSADLVFDDCQIPADALLGEENEGLKVALQTLQYGRVCVPARAVGIGQACLDHSIRYSQERLAFGKQIAEYQAIQHNIAEMSVLVEASRLMVQKAALLADQGEPFGKAASMAKYFAGEAVTEVSDLAMEVYGGYAFANEFPINRFLMIARVFRTGEGAPNIQRNLIAQDELGWKKIDRYFGKLNTTVKQ
jgi:alkylation response protein AidB-like acyl-CoA dehydrogenase